MFDIAERTRDWAIWLTQQPSVTGTPGEQALPSLMKARVALTPALKAAECWLIEAADDNPLKRNCVAVLVRGTGTQTILLTGHFDTVSVADYGDLAPLATEPELLRDALLKSLAIPATPAEMRAKADLESRDFLPGRGLLDMKSGLAAGLAVLEAFALDPDRRDNLLFVGVPDEEANSVGARALAKAIPDIQRDREIELTAAINLDAIADDGDGSEGRAITLGSVGKLLLTAFIVGQPSHACYPFSGFNSGALAGALAARMEWASELADLAPDQIGMPPTLLSIKDGKQYYDVTTPEHTFVIWNCLTLKRDARAVFDIFRELVTAETEEFCAKLRSRRKATLGIATVGGDDFSVPVIDAATLFEEAARSESVDTALKQAATRFVEEGLTLPEQCRRLTEMAFGLSGRRGPGVVIGFGSLPYPPVHLREGPPLNTLLATIEAARLRAMDRSGTSIRTTPFFQGISDMSFLGEAETGDVALIAANTPAWRSGVRWGGAVGGIPIINIGPWGRDYHTPLERLYTPYAFDTLPRLILDMAETLLKETT